MGVGGLMARPTFLPNDLIFQMSGVDLLAKFDVNDDFVRAGLGKGFQQNFRARAHEVNVKKQFWSADGWRARLPAQRKCSAQNGRP